MCSGNLLRNGIEFTESKNNDNLTANNTIISLNSRQTEHLRQLRIEGHL